MIDVNTIISTFVGGALAAGTGYLFERRKDFVRIDQTRRMLSAGIRDDLKHTIGLYEKVSEEFEKTQTIWFATLQEIRESRFLYNNNRDWVHVFNDHELRRRIFLYYLKSMNTINMLEFNQKRKSEIVNLFGVNKENIKRAEPGISDSDASSRAIMGMPNESQEFNNLMNKIIPENIAKLAQHRVEAQYLLEQLDRSSN